MNWSYQFCKIKNRLNKVNIVYNRIECLFMTIGLKGKLFFDIFVNFILCFYDNSALW